MRFIDFGQEAYGFIAIGQIATGVIAIGQVATGVIAFGQVARGVVAVGQGSVGLVAVGMGAVGVFWAGGMVGVGGSGFGLVIPLAPALGRGVVLPEPLSWAKLRQQGEGWAQTTLETDGQLAVPEGVRVDSRLRNALKAGSGAVLVHVVRVGDGLVVDQVMRIPRPRWKDPRWYGVWALQWIGLVGVALFYCGAVLYPLLDALLFSPPVTR